MVIRVGLFLFFAFLFFWSILGMCMFTGTFTKERMEKYLKRLGLASVAFVCSVGLLGMFVSFDKLF